MDRSQYYKFFQKAIDQMKYISHQLNEESLFYGMLDETASGPIIGIDLGTTNSSCAFVKDGQPQLIPNQLGYTSIPSVIAINQDGSIEVGHQAKAKMEINPIQTVYGSKRLVGRPYDSPIVREVQNRFLYKIVPGVKRLAAVEIQGRKLGLEEVSGLILKELRRMAEKYLKQNISRAVITVPAYYNENQRLSVRQAGALAGLKVERILNEPTAAAIAYGHIKKKDQRILIYDLGGGTFDVSIMQLAGNKCKVLSTGGDTFLGGVDFDGRLMDHIIEQYRQNQSFLPDLDRFSLFRVLNVAEVAKRDLSDIKITSVRYPFWNDELKKSLVFQTSVTRQKMEELVIPLVGRTLEVCDDVCAKSRTEFNQLDAILLVGGQTRMPLIWRMITEHLRRHPNKGIHPDEAVVLGAALLANAVDKSGAIHLTDVLPIPIGTGVPGGKFKKLLPAGNSVDISRTYSISTFIPNQSKLYFPIFQGENPLTMDNELLGLFCIEDIPKGPAGSRRIDLTFSLTPECLLKVSACDKDAGPLANVSMLAHEDMNTIQPSQKDNLEEIVPMRPAEEPIDQTEAGLLKKLFHK